MRLPAALRPRTFRGQLTALVFLVLLVGGVAIVVALNLLLASVLRREAQAMVEVSSGYGPPPAAGQPGPAGSVPPDALEAPPGLDPVSGLSDAVLGTMLVASLAVVLVLALAAALASRWLVDRLLARVTEVTAQARTMSVGDLSRRLSLPGPQDEIKELGDTFDAMLDRLAASFDEQQRFVANASHELRTPLAATRLALEGPLAQGRFGADVEPDVLRALDANRRSTGMLEALLQLATLQATPPSTERVELSRLVGDAVEQHRAAALAAGLGLAATVAPDVVVGGNPTLLAQAVGNLLQNAVKYAAPGSTVEVGLGVEDGSARLRVENPGASFTPAEAEQLKEPFHRGAHSRRTAGGSGLGLTLVESIMRAHEGDLHLAPRPGGGLVVELRLPAPGAPVNPAA